MLLLTDIDIVRKYDSAPFIEYTIKIAPLTTTISQVSICFSVRCHYDTHFIIITNLTMQSDIG